MTGTTPLGTDRGDAARAHLWGHFTHMDAWDAHGVPIVVRGEGHHIWDDQGRKYFDGLSGLFVVQAGHGRAELAEAARRQGEQLGYFPLWSYAHPSAIDLAERLAQHTPGDLNHVFFTSGGGEAVETAWKLAKQYWKLVGKPGKYKVEVNFYGERQALLTGGTSLQVQLFRHYGSQRVQMTPVVIRLNQARETVLVGEFEVR